MTFITLKQFDILPPRNLKPPKINKEKKKENCSRLMAIVKFSDFIMNASTKYTRWSVPIQWQAALVLDTIKFGQAIVS